MFLVLENMQNRHDDGFRQNTVIPNKYQYAELYSLQQTLSLGTFSDHLQRREIWNDYFYQKVVNRNTNKRGPVLEPCGISDSTEKREECFPKIGTKEDLSEKYL
jgi:hypothetical protein